MAGSVAIVPALNNEEKNKYHNPQTPGSLVYMGEPNNVLHYVQIKHFDSVQYTVAH